jgi:glutamate transport system substrate-binding protein
VLIIGGSEEPVVDLTKPEFPTVSSMSEIQKRGALRVAVTPERKGFSSPSADGGKLQGLEVDLATVLAQGIFGGTYESMGKYVEFIETSLPEREELVRGDSVDVVIAAYADTPERRKFANFAGHYLFAPQAPLVSAKSPDINVASDMNDLRVGVIRNATPTLTMPRIAPGAELVEFDSCEECLVALGNGSIDAFMADSMGNRAFIKYDDPTLKMAPVRCDGERWGIALRKGDDELSSFVDRTVVAALETGALNESLKRWLG